MNQNDGKMPFLFKYTLYRTYVGRTKEKEENFRTKQKKKGAEVKMGGNEKW